MAETITKIVVRRGLLNTGRTINLVQGEPGFTIDTKRLYIGDGTSAPGAVIGNKNYGIKNFLDPILFTNLLSGAEIGDIVYDDQSNLLYTLTGGIEVDIGTNSANWVKLPFVVDVDDSSIELNNLSAIQIKDKGVRARHIAAGVLGNGLVGGEGTAISVNVDNSTIDIAANKVRIKPGSLPITYLENINANSVVVNPNPFNAPPQALTLGNSQVIGRFGGNIQAIDFSTIVQNGSAVAAVNATGGISASINNNTIPATLNVSLNPTFFNTSSLASQFTINSSNTTVQDFTVNSNALVSGILRCNNDIIAFYTSDINKKNNIVNIANPLKLVDSINGVNFEWKESGEKDIGVIAQDVERVIPEAVNTRDDGTKAVDYKKIIPLLVECVKDLKKQIEELRACK